MMNDRILNAAATMVVAAFVLGGGAGCSSKLETGYVPRKLGASDETRRGFYAQPFTPEAIKAKQYEDEFGDGRRSRTGY
jgi:hypothetical protein